MRERERDKAPLSGVWSLRNLSLHVSVSSGFWVCTHTCWCASQATRLRFTPQQLAKWNLLGYVACPILILSLKGIIKSCEKLCSLLSNTTVIYQKRQIYSHAVHSHSFRLSDLCFLKLFYIYTYIPTYMGVNLYVLHQGGVVVA